MKIRNAEPKIFYGLHFQSGVAEYKDIEGQPMIYISPDTAKEMDRTFQGRPVFVEHADEVDFHDVQSADGVVVRSFYNKSDGNHWSEFLVYTDEGLSRIGEGWKLSNAYEVTEERGSGSWHGVDYDREVAKGEYEHLAIVNNPRYADSIILDAEQFKQYNIDKEAELLRLANSKGEKVMFNLFKKEKVKNSDELAKMSVVLPKSKVEKTVTQLVNEADEMENSKGVANMGDEVEIGKDKKMSVGNLLDFYKKNSKRKNEEEEEKEVENEDDDLENEKDEDEVENEDDSDLENEDEDDLENEDDELENEEEEEVEDKKKKNTKKNSVRKKKVVKKLSNAQKIANAKEAARTATANYAKLANAHKTVDPIVNSIDLGQDKVERGNNRYGSKK